MGVSLQIKSKQKKKKQQEATDKPVAFRYKMKNSTSRKFQIAKTVFPVLVILIILAISFIPPFITTYKSKGGCFFSSFKSCHLQALDNFASAVELTTGREIRRDREDYSQGFITGGTYPPEVTIYYKPIDNHTKQEVFEEIRVVLKKYKWKEYDYAPSHYYLRYDENNIEFRIYIDPDENYVVLILE